MDSALALLPIETLRTRLNEALDAQHALAMGRRVVLATTTTGQRVQYSEGNSGELRLYITALQNAILAKGSGRVARQPVYLSF